MSDADAPKWRKDFPIEWGEDNYVTRREFTKFLVMISGATAFGNGYFVLKKLQSERVVTHPPLAIAGADELQHGAVKLFRYPTENDPALLIRLPGGEHVAYLQRCTHLTCPVMYSSARRRIECPCHNGAFDAATGRVLSGPPPRPLPRIVLRVEKGQVFAVGIASGNEAEDRENEDLPNHSDSTI